MGELLRQVRGLRSLPADRRQMLVVRSMPFGDIIEDDTRRVHVVAQNCPRWRDLSYRICERAKGDS